MPEFCRHNTGESSSEDEGKLNNSGNTDGLCPLCLGSGRRNGSLDREYNQVSGAGRRNDERQTNREIGHWIGSLFRSKQVIGKGSDGTTVFKGTYGKRDDEKRSVAVKRLVKGHQRVESQEIERFIESDKHPNILRYFTKEEDDEFTYLALELCDFSLDDLIQAHSDFSNKDLPHEYKSKLNFVKDVMRNDKLFGADSHPSPLLLKLMRDIVSGLICLHQLKIIHRDLNPRNVLITNHPLCAKLSDMGISKRLPRHKSSLGLPASGSGTRGWQAPEQLLRSGSQTCKMDMFNLGCLLYFCLTKGGHPFGEDDERDVNIKNEKMDLSSEKLTPEAVDLISRLLKRPPELRPEAREVLYHPSLWDSRRRLSFLCDLSDILQLEDPKSDFLKALQATRQVVFGGIWTSHIEINFMNHLKKHRKYYGHLVQELLRAVRNASHHLQESPKKVQEIFGSVPEGVEAYFAKIFPNLLIESYKVAFQFCRKENRLQENRLQEYFFSDQLPEVPMLDPLADFPR